MKDSDIKIYGYRWVVLFVFAIINAVVQIQWLTFAPIAGAAQSVYNVSALQIDFLSMIYMIVFIILCIPASYIIDTYGIRIGIGFGAILAGISGLLKGIYATDYTMVCIAQIGLAISQPFVLNAITKVGVRWFPINERATAAGIGALAQYIGIVVVMIATPNMISMDANGKYNISDMLMTYGIITAVGALLLLIFLREKPETPPCLEGQDDRIQVFAGLKHIFKNRDMLLLLLVFFIGLGMFNAISTCIEQICKLKGLNFEQSGLVGGIMLIGGVFGASILPPLSDKFRKRKIFIVICVACMIPGIAGLAFASSYWLLLVSATIFGFFLMAVGPIGFQYSAEISAPAPESTAQGLILLAGQISGIVFVFGMNRIGMIPFMVFFIVCSAVCFFLCTMLKESPMITAG
ncbi:MFS transporter [bacterium]|nr:MFS transporter [bacterium]